METLSINNFAGLKEVSIEVRPVTGFIGPQASGKSIIAKLLYFFREIGRRLPDAVEDGMGSEYKTECCKRFTRYFPSDSTGASGFQLAYASGDQRVRVAFGKTKSSGDHTLEMEWSEFYSAALEKFAARKQELLAALVETDKEGLEGMRQTLRREYYGEASKALGPWSKCQQVFIPAGRAFFSQFQARVFTRLDSGEVLDPFMVAFGSLLEHSKLTLEVSGFFDSADEILAPPDAESFDEILYAFREILHADLVRIENGDFLDFGEGRLVSLSHASSGHQEVLPLLLLLAQFFSYASPRGRAIYIEEPETHLYPATQRQIVEFLARVFRKRHHEMHLAITTHSPYVLTSINNLLQAGKLYETADLQAKRKLEKIVPESRSFKPGEVAFYALEDGHAKSIIDAETGLIDASAIDEVSNDIATEFDELLAEANEKP